MSSRPGHAAVDDGHVAVLLPASRLVPNTTTPVRRARYLALAFAAFLGFAALAPWRQSVSGTGQVFAFLPDERPQVIEATISGRIARWHVVEGQQVEEGELLVELSDNDPDRLARLTLERDAQAERIARLEADNERLEKELAKTRAVVDVQAKLHVLLETLSESTDCGPRSKR